MALTEISNTEIKKVILSEDESYHNDMIYNNVKQNIKKGNINPIGPVF